MKMKLNLINHLQTRVDKVTHSSLRDDSLEELQNIPLENSFLKSLVNKILFNSFYSNFNSNNHPPINNKIHVYKSLPHIADLTKNSLIVTSSLQIKNPFTNQK